MTHACQPATIRNPTSSPKPKITPRALTRCQPNRFEQTRFLSVSTGPGDSKKKIHSPLRPPWHALKRGRSASIFLQNSVDCSVFWHSQHIPGPQHHCNPPNRSDYASAGLRWSNTLLPICWLLDLGPWCPRWAALWISRILPITGPVSALLPENFKNGFLLPKST